MKSINTYIVEKFKITKDIQNVHELTPKKKALRVVYSQNSNGNHISLDIIRVDRFKVGDKLHIMSDDNQASASYLFEKELYINSNGFYEFDIKCSTWEGNSLYLNKEDGIEILNKVFKDFKSNKSKLKDYFDESDDYIDYTKIIDDLRIDETVEQLIDDLKNE